MPIYEYTCSACKSIFEEWQSSFQEQEQKCPQCGEFCKRLISQSAFHLKGGGWYVTDYSNSGAKENASVAPVQSEVASSSGEASPKTDAVSTENVSKK